ncbi:hypothetical protein H4582DRAFT_288128 [Lactarius indigo]|nr:hypothetical protein H4582DRAFT_288128 [Lactarius indigo]
MSSKRKKSWPRVALLHDVIPCGSGPIDNVDFTATKSPTLPVPFNHSQPASGQQTPLTTAGAFEIRQRGLGVIAWTARGFLDARTTYPHYLPSSVYCDLQNTLLSSTAAAQDLDHRQMFSNSPGPSGSRNSGGGTQIAEPQGSISRVEVIVLRAHDLPRMKKRLGPKRRFYVTVTNGAATEKTKSTQVDGSTARWDQTLGPL